MHAKDSAVNHSSKREVVKDLATPPPDIAAPVLALALVVEAVHLRYLTRFMVATDERHSFWVPDFEG